MERALFFLTIFITGWSFCSAQAPQLKFLHLNTENGLPDGTVRSVTEDKYGYIWLGTQYGLCRFNGYDQTIYFHHKGDSTSIAGNFIWSTYTDLAGDVWIGNDGFLSKYHYRTGDFDNYPCPFKGDITKIVEDKNGVFWLATSRGLMSFDLHSKRFTHFRDHENADIRKVGSTRINDLYFDAQKRLIYLATSEGFKILDIDHNRLFPPFLQPENDPYHIYKNVITAIAKDKDGFIWFSCGFNSVVVAKWNPIDDVIQYYNDFSSKRLGWSENRILSMYADHDGRIWVGGFTSSLSLYLPEKDVFHHYRHDPLLKSSIAGTSIIHMYQDRSGMIWVGTEGYGMERFHLNTTVFTSIQPQADIQPSLLHDWGRAAMEDSKGNIWLGTAKGISVYNPSTSTFRNYFNSEQNPTLLSFNTIRSFAEDNNGHVWIGTGNWLNRFDSSNEKFRIYNRTDSLKSYFVWSLLVRSNGELYAGGTGGLQKYESSTDHFVDVDVGTELGKNFRYNVRNLYEDADQGIWIGLYDRGLMYYHPEKNIVRLYQEDEKSANALCDNFVTSVTEDKKGTIWISTRDGLNSLDVHNQTFHVYTTADGLPSNKTSALRVDSTDRLWIATGNGLSVLDKERAYFRNYGISDGLPTNEFNDQTASTTHDGKLIYPTYRGFVMFNPNEILSKEAPVTKIYVSAFKLFNINYPLEQNLEEVKNIQLKATQNYFSIELTGLNYEDPGKVFYAYKLEPLNEEWIYTKERNITYANLPGHKYKFLYKSTIDPSDWNIPVHQLNIAIATVFYKTSWFILFMIILLSALIYRIYSFRLSQTRNVHKLQLQATMLERDKTEIQYQNLINQFNPHFLFNSLTSLNSLIYENKELASDFLEQLSAVYRYLLTNKDNQLVSLDAEINFVHHYISLLKTRFENKLMISIDIPQRLLQKKIVPITFQIMIENAIKHNTVDEGFPLFISFTADEKYLYVKNNVQKKAFVETSNRKGLKSLQSLYKYLSATPIVIHQSLANFEIWVPLL